MKTLLIGAAALFGFAGMGLAVFWSQINTLPDWYRQQPAVRPPVTPEQGHATKLTIVEAVNRQLDQAPARNKAANRSDTHATAAPQQTVQLNAQQVNQLIEVAIASVPEAQTLQPAIKGIHTEIRAGKIETGLVVNTAELSTAQLPPPLQFPIESALRQFPFLKREALYVGIKGRPALAQGQLVLNPETHITLGGITLPLQEASAYFGIPEAVLTQPIPLQVGRLQVQDMQLSDRTLTLTGQAIP